MSLNRANYYTVGHPTAPEPNRATCWHAEYVESLIGLPGAGISFARAAGFSPAAPPSFQ